MSDGQLVKPFLPIRSTGLLALIGINEEIEASQYGASVAHSLAFVGDGSSALHSGTVRGITLHSSEAGTGAVMAPACRVVVFSANPAITAGAAALASAAIHETILGIVEVIAEDWLVDALGATATVPCEIPFHEVAGLWFAIWLEAGSTTINSAGADDELMKLVARYRLDS